MMMTTNSYRRQFGQIQQKVRAQKRKIQCPYQCHSNDLSSSSSSSSYSKKNLKKKQKWNSTPPRTWKWVVKFTCTAALCSWSAAMSSHASTTPRILTLSKRQICRWVFVDDDGDRRGGGSETMMVFTTCIHTWFSIGWRQHFSMNHDNHHHHHECQISDEPRERLVIAPPPYNECGKQ